MGSMHVRTAGRAGFLSGSRRRQLGQSLTETAIACTVLVPMFLMIALLGQYIHLRQQAQASARTAAWDAAVHPNLVSDALPATATEQARLRAWQYGTTDAALKTDPGTVSRFTDPMLTTFAGRDLVLAKNVTLNTYTNGESPAAMSKAIDKIGGVASAVGLGQFPPDKHGLITAEVHARPEHVTDANGNALTFLDPLDHMDLDFYGRTVLLADAWDANGPGEDNDGNSLDDSPRKVRAVIRPLSPGNYLGDKLGGVADGALKVVGKLPIISTFFPGFDELRIGKAAPDVVPADKLQAYGK